MSTNLSDLASKFLRKNVDDLSEEERRVLEGIVERRHISRKTNRVFEESLTRGQRIADRVAAFGGSWTFIMLFLGVLALWIILNSLILFHLHRQFDPYPFILLNLVLSMLAAIQAPVILMSQNRHSAKDRLDAAHDYEVNLKTELEIRLLHEKVDEIREQKWEGLLTIQQKQIEMLTKILGARGEADAAR